MLININVPQLQYFVLLYSCIDTSFSDYRIYSYNIRVGILQKLSLFGPDIMTWTILDELNVKGLHILPIFYFIQGI